MVDKKIVEAFVSTFIRSEFLIGSCARQRRHRGKLFDRVCHKPSDLLHASRATGSCSSASVSCIGGSTRPASSLGPTEPTRCTGPRHHWSAVELAACGPANSCVATSSWKVSCGTSASKSMMRWRPPDRRTSELTRLSPRPGRVEERPATDTRTCKVACSRGDHSLEADNNLTVPALPSTSTR